MPEAPLRIFVGTDQRMGRAERVLEHSIRKHSTIPVEITWMRAGDPGFAEEWDRGRAPGRPYSGVGWATDFTCFRFAVPELAGFHGRAVYLDVDMIVLADVRELAEIDIDAVAAVPGRPWDVIVWDCERAARVMPSIRLMQKGATYRDLDYRLHSQEIVRHDLDPRWDCRDYVPEDAKLVHFTNMRTQPWHPWPEAFTYPPKHPDRRCQQLWDTWEAAATAAPVEPC